MKKLIAIALIVLLAASSVFAGGASESTSSSADNGKIKVRIWTVDRHDANFWTEKVDEYNATNTDNIEVSYEIYADNFQQAVDLAFQTGEAPDIMKYAQYFDKYVLDGRFVDLLPYLSDEEKALTESVWYNGYNLIDGKLYFIPLENSCMRLFYNKTIFERLGLKVPETLEEMKEAALTITNELSGEGIYGFACNLKGANSGIMRSLEPQVELGEGVYKGYDFGKGVYDFTAYIPYLEAWKEMIANGFPGCESLDIDPLRSQFAAGKIGMYMSYTASEPGVYENQFPFVEGQEWGCTYMPVVDGEIKGAEYYTGTPAFLINAASKNVDASVKAYKAIFLDKENLKEHFEQGYGISNFQEILDTATMNEVYASNPALLKTEHDVIYPKTPDELYPQDFILEGLDMYNTFSAMIFGQMDIEKGIADLNKRYNVMIEKLIEQGLYERIINLDYARK